MRNCSSGFQTLRRDPVAELSRKELLMNLTVEKNRALYEDVNERVILCHFFSLLFFIENSLYIVFIIIFTVVLLNILYRD